MNIAQLRKLDPMTLDLRHLPDAFKALNTLRLAMQKETDAVEADEKAFKQALILRLEKGVEKGVYGLQYKAEIKSERAFQVNTQAPDGGWQSVWQWIYETGRTDLIQKRLNDTVLKAMYENKEALPPGILTLTVPKVSITKIQ